MAAGAEDAIALTGQRAQALTAQRAEALTAQRVQALTALFRHVAATRMAGIPILHPRLEVQAVGFAPEPEGRACVGVLVTPWFMNLMRLPLAADEAIAAVGVSLRRQVGREAFDFIGGDEAGFGRYESCSLFSPMGDFADHAAALATAQAVLDELRRPPEPPAREASPAPPGPAEARRALLFGRAAATGAAR